MVVQRNKRTKEGNEWIRNFVFEFKSPKTLRLLESREQESFHPGSNKGGNGYGMVCVGSVVMKVDLAVGHSTIVIVTM